MYYKTEHQGRVLTVEDDSGHTDEDALKGLWMVARGLLETIAGLQGDKSERFIQSRAEALNDLSVMAHDLRDELE